MISYDSLFYTLNSPTMLEKTELSAFSGLNSNSRLASHLLCKLFSDTPCFTGIYNTTDFKLPISKKGKIFA